MRNHIYKKYDRENFRAEKIVATLYLAAFCFIVGFGFQKQLSGTTSELTSNISTNVVPKS